MYRKFAGILVCCIGFIVFQSLETDAGVKRGKWVDYYDGNAFPVGAVCANSLLTKKCVIGDRKTYSNPSFSGINTD